MDARAEKRRTQILQEAKLKPQVHETLLEDLADFLIPFLDQLERKGQEEHLREYVQGLLSDLPYKNVESIAYLHDHDRRNLQRFIGESAWDHRPLLATLGQQVGKEIGEADGVIVFDPSGFEKEGKHSVGVKRQWLGRLGKVDNGQVGIYLGYVSRQGHALCNTRLYLPEEWAKDRERRRECGVPKEVRFRTRHQLAQEMLLEQGAVLPHQWVAGDDELGRSSEFRKWLRERREQYLLAVPSNTSMREIHPQEVGADCRKMPWQAVRAWLGQLPNTAWETLHVVDGEKGPLTVEAVKCRAQTKEARGHVGPEELLFVTRVKETNGWKVDYYLTNAPAETSLAELARVAKAEHRIEDCFRRAKGEAGLADYEVRTWRGWHHHQALSLLAVWFLTLATLRGKKNNGSRDRTGHPRLLGVVVASGLDEQTSGMGNPLH